MDQADNEMNEQDSTLGGRQSRRTALKAGVAVGVGALAWGGPQIGPLGVTPAYATHCTAPLFGFFIGCNNTIAGCTDGVGYKPISGSFGTGGQLTSLFPQAGGCPEDSPQATIKVPTGFAGCRLTVVVHEGNCKNDWTWVNSGAGYINGQFCVNGACELDRASTGGVIGAGVTGTVTLPTVTCNGAGGGTIDCGVFWSAIVECSTSTTCF